MSRLNMISDDVRRRDSLPFDEENSFSRRRPSPPRSQPNYHVVTNRIGSIRNQIQPTNLKQEDYQTAMRSRKLLAENIEKGQGDLNMIWDKDRIQRKERRRLAFTIFSLSLLGMILVGAIAGLGVSVYMMLTNSSSNYKMIMFGIISSSIALAYALFSITVVSIDGFYLRRKRIEMTDYKFLLDVDIKQFSMNNENILLYTPELVTNQIVPRYMDVPLSASNRVPNTNIQMVASPMQMQSRPVMAVPANRVPMTPIRLSQIQQVPRRSMAFM